MAGFSPQPFGTGPVFPISLSRVAPVSHYSSLLPVDANQDLAPEPGGDLPQGRAQDFLVVSERV